ncbi:molybdenum cofactor guanylyltransferase [bacterium]|nr:molybdenum cofactor guanylyltransferase [bacterium]
MLAAQPKPLRFTGIILAGGSSTRFGAAKADVVWRGASLLSHVAARLRQCCREVVAVARDEQATDGWPVDRVVRDDPGMEASPLRGMVAGLSACRHPAALVVACDTPCLVPALLAKLQEGLAADMDACVAEWDGRPQPLVAAYRARVGEIFHRALSAGERSPRRALYLLKVVMLSESECLHLDPQGLSFRNLNEPEDLERLEELLGASS